MSRWDVTKSFLSETFKHSSKWRIILGTASTADGIFGYAAKGQGEGEKRKEIEIPGFLIPSSKSPAK